MMFFRKPAVLLIFGFIANGLFPLKALAAEICVAQKVWDISYASTMHYQVNCKNQEFNTPFIFTTFLVPLPYHWGDLARKKLSKVMEKRGYLPAGKINKVTTIESTVWGFNQKGTREVALAFKDPVLVFSKSNQKQEYCGVVQSNPRQIGAAQKMTVYDFTVSCGPRTVKEHFTGITKVEFDEYMQNLGAKFAFSAGYVGTDTPCSVLLIYERN